MTVNGTSNGNGVHITQDHCDIASYPDLKDKVVFRKRHHSSHGIERTSATNIRSQVTGIGQTGDQEMWGNGAATARLLSRNGAKIFGCDLYLEAAQHTQKRIAAEGGDVTVVAADVTSDKSVKEAVDACVAKYGRIDILVK